MQLPHLCNEDIAPDVNFPLPILKFSPVPRECMLNALRVHFHQKQNSAFFPIISIFSEEVILQWRRAVFEADGRTSDGSDKQAEDVKQCGGWSCKTELRGLVSVLYFDENILGGGGGGRLAHS